MRPRPMSHVPRPSQPAFTLVELLVVILIIGVLMGILIPVVGIIRRKAQAASSLAQINSIRGAIEAYQGTYNAYPGPIPDIYMFTVDPGTPPLPNGIVAAGTNARMTQSENLTLALFGGLSDQNGQITFNPADVGNGPRVLSMGNPGQHPAFYTSSKELSKGFIKDSVEITGSSGFDTNIPEFIDKFNDPMPILYLRARKGAKGVISDEQYFAAMNPATLFQYDVRQYYQYMADLSKTPPDAPLIVAGVVQAGPDPRNGNQAMGIWKVGANDPSARNINDPSNNLYNDRIDRYPPPFDGKDHKPPRGTLRANYALPYFANATVGGPMTNFEGTSRANDSFILISAGPDRLFGTADDLTTFGNVLP